MKRLFCFCVLFCVILSSIEAFAFTDDAEIERLSEHRYIFSDDIKYWAERGVICGDQYGRFNPSNYVTRAEFTKMAVLAAGKTEIPEGEDPAFNDVSPQDWFFPYVKIAYQNGIIEGDEFGNFNPDAYIDFGEITLIGERAFQKMSSISNILDTERPQRDFICHVLTVFNSSTEPLLRVDCSIEKSRPECGLYKTVNEALAAAPDASSEETRVHIGIMSGTYREHIVIDKPYITLYNYDYGDVLLTYYYGASRSYKSFDALSADMEYPERDKYTSDEDYKAAVKNFESKKTLLHDKPYVKSDGYISGVGTQNSASVTITAAAHDFTSRGITFENSYNLYMTEEEKSDIYEPTDKYDLNLSENLDEKKRNEAWFDSASARRKDVTVADDKTAQTQAVALRCSADRSSFMDCKFIGRQDTLYVKDKARCYFGNCKIEGTVDFIFGDANAVFDHCDIHSCEYPNGGYITACSHSAEQSRGFLFYCCRLTGDEPLNHLENSGKVKLGRVWKPDALVIYYKCYMGNHIAVGNDRFANMGKNKKENGRFCEISSRDLDGNYFADDVYADYEYTEDCRYKFAVTSDYLLAPFGGEADNWIPFKGWLLEYYDDGEIVDGTPVWYDNANLYKFPEL